MPAMNRTKKTIAYTLFKRLVPNSVVRRCTPTLQGKDKEVHQHHHRPIALLLGWGGAKASSLNKQRDYYTSKGFATVVHVMPLGVLGFIRSQYEQEIMENIETLSCSMRPKEGIDVDKRTVELVHCYSNNGIWTLAGLCRNFGLRAKNIIFDSTPGLYFECQSRMYVMKICEVFVSSILAKDVYWHPLLSPFMLLVLYPLIQIGNMTVLLQKLVGVNLVSDIVDFNLYLRDHPKDIINDDCRCLFVYSSGDKLLPSWLIEEYIENIKNRGVSDVMIKTFGDDVPHTSSFYKYPEDYKKEIELLLQSSSLFNTDKKEK